MRGAAKKIVGIAGASAIQTTALSLLSIVLARFLTIEEFGITRVVTTYLIVLCTLGHFCLHDAVASYIAGDRKPESQSHYIFSATALVMIISLGVVGVAEVVIVFSGLWTGRVQETLSVVVTSLPIAALVILYSSVLQAVGSIRQLGYFLLLSGLVPLVMMGVLAWRWNLMGWTIGRISSYVILVVIGLYFLRGYISIWPSPSAFLGRAKSLLRYARVQFVSGVISIAMQSADLIALERLGTDLEIIAAYSLAALFARSAMVFPGAVGRVYFQDIAKETPHRWGSVRRMFTTVVAVCIVLIVGLWAIFPAFLHGMYGSRYDQSVPILHVMLAGVIFNGCWGCLSVANIAIRRPDFAVATSIAGASVCVLGMVALIPTYGAIGAAWAMNLAYVVGTLVGGSLLIRKRQSEKVKTARGAI